MPAWRLDANDREVHNFDVGGSDGDAAEFVAHVVLCLAERPQVVNRASRDVSVVHMGPPFRQSAWSIDVIGSAFLDADGLAPSEKRQIKMFIDDRVRERKAQEARLARLRGLQVFLAEYVVHPPYLEPTSDVSLWRFSCAGFVIRAYEEAKIRLVDFAKIPTVELDTLKVAYPGIARLLDSERIRSELGIGAGSAWSAVLAGYVVNSLNRPSDVIRREAYIPRPGDEFFPSRSPHT